MDYQQEEERYFFVRDNIQPAALAKGSPKPAGFENYSLKHTVYYV
ncbi:hypothetical protein [Pontibacter burrus]|nr:hypothetical protein [Pontibacter burrus]